MKKLALLAALILALGGCASTGGEAKAPATAESAKEAIAAAEAAVKQAKGNEWRDTGKFIKQAKEALEKKDFEKAVKLAKKAKSQGEMAAAQGKAEANAGPWLF
ncbi:hypothetical protein [Kaarinaea lacus]